MWAANGAPAPLQIKLAIAQSVTEVKVTADSADITNSDANGDTSVMTAADLRPCRSSTTIM